MPRMERVCHPEQFVPCRPDRVESTARSNAPMESFWGSMQIELLNRQQWRTNTELAVAIADYVEQLLQRRPPFSWGPARVARRCLDA